MITMLLLFALQQATNHGRGEELRPLTPNLDQLALERKSLKKTGTYTATDASGKTALTVDRESAVYPRQFYEDRYVFRLPSGDVYDLNTRSENNGLLRISLRLPDSSIISLRSESTRSNATLTYLQQSVSLDLSRSLKGQLDDSRGSDFLASLPLGGYALVGVIDHVRESLCRQAGLCGGSLDAILDLFRDPGQTGADPMEARDERGWELKSYNQSRIVETVPPPR